MGRLGVIVALLAFVSTASADKAKPKAPPAKAKVADKAPASDAAPAADDTATDGSASDGSADDSNIPPHITGPALVDLGNNTEVDLPAGLILLERTEGAKFVEKQGGSSEGLEALVFSLEGDWWVRIDYDDVGYVTDSDANDLDANAILDSYKQGTLEQNQRRKSLGLPELFLDGWMHPPAYDKGTHHLAWGLKGHSERGVSVNEFQRVLGRNGYLSVDVISSPEKIDAAKAAAAPLIANTRFKAGSKYEDHKAADKSSGMGLKALVVGGAGVAVFAGAKSGGIIAILLALKKGLILVVAGIAAFFKKIFGGKAKGPQLPPDGPPVG